LAQLSTEDLFDIWDVIIRHVYQLSVPYVARVVRVESILPAVAGAQVQRRLMDYRNVPVGA
jgi:hypothetical protein